MGESSKPVTGLHPTDASPSCGHVETRLGWIPICAIEANIYTIPATSTSLVYVSKVDTTGLSTTAISPTRTLVGSFLQFHLLYPPHATNRVRIHVFASAQPQYLFPGSIENTTKHVLDDKGLLRWWKATIAGAVSAPGVVATVSATRPAPQLFYLVPGLDYLGSLPYVPPPPLGAPNPTWTYGHPYAILPSPLHPASVPASDSPLPDHIPSFPDDPKSRFLMSLTSSTTAPSGNEGDYDDVMLGLASAAFTTGHASASRAAEVEHVRDRERARLVGGVEGGVSEWWERMAYRQECCSGVLVGFFVVARDAVIAEAAVRKEAPKKYPAGLPHRLFTTLWSQFHNVDYSRPLLGKCAVAADKWREDVKRVVGIEANAAVGPKPAAPIVAPQAGTPDATLPAAASDKASAAAATTGDEAAEALRKAAALYKAEVSRELVIDNPAYVRENREAPSEVLKVNMLAPRKKKKVQA